MQTEITIGYVLVYTPERDCEGAARTVDFPRLPVGQLGQPRHHWTAKRHVPAARRAAVAAIKAHNAATGRNA